MSFLNNKFALVQIIFICLNFSSCSLFSDTKNYENLKVAVLENKFRKVEYYLKKSVPLDSLNEMNETLLMLACQDPEIDIAIIQLLIKFGANLYHESDITLKNPIQLIYESKTHEDIEIFFHGLNQENLNIFTNNLFFLKDFMYPEDLITFHKILPLCLDYIISSDLDSELLNKAVKDWAEMQEAQMEQIHRNNESLLEPLAFKKIVQELLDSGIDINRKNYNDSIFMYGIKSPDVIKFLIYNGYNCSKKIAIHNKDFTSLDAYLRYVLSRINSRFEIFDEPIHIYQPEKLSRELEIIKILSDLNIDMSNDFESPFCYLVFELSKNNKMKELKLLLSFVDAFNSSESKLILEEIRNFAKKSNNKSLINIINNSM